MLKLLVVDEALTGMESEASTIEILARTGRTKLQEKARSSTASPDKTSGDDDFVDRSSERRRPCPVRSTRDGVSKGKVVDDSDVESHSDGKVTVASVMDKTTPRDHLHFRRLK